MSNVIKLSLIGFIINICGQTQGTTIIPDCVTPDDNPGMCVDLKYCVNIMTALINKDHIMNPVVGEFLRKSQCGTKAGSHKVCCNINSIDFGEEPHDTNSRRGDEEITIQHSTIDKKRCGELALNETPLKWIAELWFNRDTFGRVELESRCLGALISLKHIIVPAHCVASLPANISLAHARLQNHEYKVLKIFIHANYNQPKFANDIAIIELDPDTADSGEINNAICLETSTTNASKSSLTIMKNARKSHQYGKIEFISDNDCSTFLEKQYTVQTPGQFCANIQPNETEYSPFIGAVVLQTNNRQYALKAFTSTAIRREQSHDESRPFIFTDVEHHLDWIQNAIGDISPSIASISSADSSFDQYKECPLINSNLMGYCVPEEECSLFSAAPRPISTLQKERLEQMKCINDDDYEDIEKKICCPPKYINQSKLSVNTLEVDEKFRFKRGVKLLDLNKCGQAKLTTRIVGGQRAGLKEFPWFGLIKYHYGQLEKFTCGSSLISARYVLTCAHCITNLPYGYRITAIRLGEYDLQTNPDCDPDSINVCNPPVQDIEVVKLIPHQQYNNPRYSNDIGLVRLAREPDMTKGIVPICLPVNSALQGPFVQKYVVTGFGLTEHGRESDVLLKIFVPKVEKETCQSFHRSLITLSDGQECYGGEGITDSCKGDSGGPAMNLATNTDGSFRMVQVGIVAAGHSQCGRGIRDSPGIYTDVKYYMEWILDNMEE